MQKTVRVSSRFNGPPTSGNGGYVMGMMGEALGGGCVEASLLKPPPLDKDLLLAADGETAELFDGDTLIGKAVKASMQLDVPALPAPLIMGVNPVEALGVRGSFVPFQTCFVCGEDCTPGDGLCIHSKLVEGHSGMVAAPWTLDRSLAGADGCVDPLYIWGALDCPGYFACAAGEAALLAQFTVHISESIEAEGTAIVLGWDMTEDHTSRKRRSGTALYNQHGKLVAKAEALWITISIDQLPGAT